MVNFFLVLLFFLHFAAPSFSNDLVECYEGLSKDVPTVDGYHFIAKPSTNSKHFEFYLFSKTKIIECSGPQLRFDKHEVGTALINFTKVRSLRIQRKDLKLSHISSNESEWDRIDDSEKWICTAHELNDTTVTLPIVREALKVLKEKIVIEMNDLPIATMNHIAKIANVNNCRTQSNDACSATIKSMKNFIEDKLADLKTCQSVNNRDIESVAQKNIKAIEANPELKDLLPAKSKSKVNPQPETTSPTDPAHGSSQH